MELIIESKQTEMLNPAKEGARRTIRSEIRRDPLTGRSARICHFMALRWEKPDFDRLIAGTAERCPFCPERIDAITPRFPPEIVADGCLHAGRMRLFPNLAPYDALSAVATLGDPHFVPMTGFSPRTIAAGFGLALRFFREIDARRHPESVHHLINWNYMPPAGSSLIHPHLQVFATASAPNLLRQEIEAAHAYHQRHGSNFWDDLVAHESADGRRLLGRIGRTAWLSSFAPMGVAGDVLAITAGTSGTLDLESSDLNDIAHGLTRVMAAYDAMGIYSFNMNFFSAAPGDPSARFHLLFSPRTFFNQSLGTTDVGALRNLFNETICMAPPEEIAALLRAPFQPHPGTA
jgi:galactose-1-phosphate uridylyltransferase